MTNIYKILKIISIVCTGILLIKWIVDSMKLFYNIIKLKVKNDDLIDNIFSNVPSYPGLILYAISKGDLIYELALMLLMVFSFTHIELLFAYALILIIFKLGTFSSFWKAVVRSIGRLAILELLIYTGIYAFTVFAFYYYPTDYPDNNCYSLLTWFTITADNFPKHGSGIGEYLKSSYNPHDDNTIGIKYWRIIYDNLAYIIIVVFMNGIFTGIVVDTFGEIRDHEKELRDDEQSSCFIWGKSRKELEKEDNYKGFESHVKGKHNKWNYIYFVHYLLKKSRDDKDMMTDSEEYVLNKIEEKDQSWFPCYKND